MVGHRWPGGDAHLLATENGNIGVVEVGLARDLQTIAKDARPMTTAEEPQLELSVIQYGVLVEAQFAPQPHAAVADVDEEVIPFLRLVIYIDRGAGAVKLRKDGKRPRKIARGTEIFEPTRSR